MSSAVGIAEDFADDFKEVEVNSRNIICIKYLAAGAEMIIMNMYLPSSNKLEESLDEIAVCMAANKDRRKKYCQKKTILFGDLNVDILCCRLTTESDSESDSYLTLQVSGYRTGEVTPDDLQCWGLDTLLRKFVRSRLLRRYRVISNKRLLKSELFSRDN